MDLTIEIGKSVSQIAAGEPDVCYRQNCLYAGQDTDGTWYPIGHVIKDGAFYQEYWRDYPWSAFVVPNVGKPYIGKIDTADIPGIKLGFYAGPRLVKDGKNVVAEAIISEDTAGDIAYSFTWRSMVGIKEDGTILLVTTKENVSLETAAKLMIELGAVDALNLDGGGSVSKNYNNEPYGAERKIGSALIVRGKENHAMTKNVVIDPGHGGRDPGASGNGIVEKDFNLNMARKVAGYLKQKYVVNVTMTRANDTFIELDERAAIANRINADYFVSIHANASANNQRGFETFVYTGQRGKSTGVMQDAVHAELIACLEQLGMPDRGKKEADFRVLEKTDMAAILIEYGFVDNAEDAALLKGHTETLAALTADGIAKACGLQAVQAPELAFSDVPTGSWYENAVKVVSSPQYGFMTGYEDGTFRPNQPITRAELAKVLNDLIYWVEHR